jgi:hypothetical protein
VAIIAANLIGLIGLLLAAPGLATINLVSRYTVRKMLDRDPWVDYTEQVEPMGIPWVGKLFSRISTWWNSRKSNQAVNNKERR